MTEIYTDIQVERSAAIRNAMSGLKTALASEVIVATIDEAKACLLGLAKQASLFPRSEFPLPTEGQNGRTFCIYTEPDGQFSLYVITATRGMTYRPHNHGNSWAIVAAVEGQERHYLYQRTDDQSVPGKGQVEVVSELIVEPGNGISILEGGIHSIETANEEPLLHLHCYGWDFDHQTARIEFDVAAGTCELNNDIGLIEQVPLAPNAL